MASRSNDDTSCKCGSKNCFLRYSSNEDVLPGVCCSKCGREWLKETYLNNSDSDEFIRLSGSIYLLNQRRQARDDQYMVQYNRTKLNNLEYAVGALNPGNHIQWEKWPYDHHGIVEKVNREEKTIDVIEYQSVGCLKEKVTRNMITLDSIKTRNLYRIDYDETEADPCYLILARARAWLGQARYKLFVRNGKTFSVYCVVGSFVRWQAISVASKLRRCALAVWKKNKAKTAAEVAYGEIVESASAGVVLSNLVGAGVVTAVEGTAVVCDVKKLYDQRQDGGLSRKDFCQNTSKRIIVGLFVALFVALGSMLGEFAGRKIGTSILSRVGTFWCGLVGSVFLGIVMSAPGEHFGALLGRWLGKTIAAMFKIDDRFVRFRDLRRGDQIIRYAWFLHPRCHAIVTDVNRDERTVTVIRESHSNGVIREVLDFVPPVYRFLILGISATLLKTPLGELNRSWEKKKYKRFFYNCEDFVTGCIKIREMHPISVTIPGTVGV